MSRIQKLTFQMKRRPINDFFNPEAPIQVLPDLSDLILVDGESEEAHEAREARTATISFK
jgi:hypothetical protein